MSIGRTLSGDPLSHTHSVPHTHTHACREKHAYARSVPGMHTYKAHVEVSVPCISALLQWSLTNKRTDMLWSPHPPIVQQYDRLCVWMWPLAQGPSPLIYHQSFDAIKHFSMRIARSSLSKTERSDSQSHFLPNPIKGGEGRGGKNEVEDLKWRAFI